MWVLRIDWCFKVIQYYTSLFYVTTNKNIGIEYKLIFSGLVYFGIEQNAHIYNYYLIVCEILNTHWLNQIMNIKSTVVFKIFSVYGIYRDVKTTLTY